MNFLKKINHKTVTVNLAFIVVFIASIIFINPNFPFYFEIHQRLALFIILSIIAFFYIHNTVLFSFLKKENNIKKYRNAVFYNLAVFIVTVFCLYFFHSKDTSYIWYIDYNDFFTIKELSKIILAAFIPTGILIFITSLYIVFFSKKKKLLVFIEFLVNFIVVSLLYTISIGIGKGVSTLLLTLVLCLFYNTAFYISPIILKQKNKQKFWTYISLFSVGFYVLFLLIFLTLGKGRIPFYILFNLVLVVIATQIFGYVYGYIRLKIIAKEQVLNFKLGTKESELRLLKSQVNPHFLFNTLNTLYGTALEENATKTAESTAKLANLIRYMQEDISKDFIPLKNEIKYVEDYITIQKMRCAVEPEIHTEFKNIEDQKISPGLLIPFVENAFKYGIDPTEKSKLIISVVCDEATIYFECKNSFNSSFKTHQKEQGFGIGITNTKQRLDLVYPKKHTLIIEKEDAVFTIKLTINI